MTKQSLQLSTLTLADSLTTLLRIQFSSALEPRNLFLLVADIYRRISFLPTKIQTYIMNDNRPLKIDKKTITEQDRTTANTGFASGGVTCFVLTESVLCASYQVQYWQTVLCFKIRFFAKRQNVNLFIPQKPPHLFISHKTIKPSIFCGKFSIKNY